MVELVNVASAAATDQFEIDEDELRALLIGEIVKSKSELLPEHVMVWHTHPGGLVGPSAGDMELKQKLASQGLDFRWCVVALSLGDELAVATEY